MNAIKISYQPTDSYPRHGEIIDGELEIPMAHESWWVKVDLRVTGRTLSKTPTGGYGTKALLTFVDEATTIPCWVIS